MTSVLVMAGSCFVDLLREAGVRSRTGLVAFVDLVTDVLSLRDLGMMVLLLWQMSHCYSGLVIHISEKEGQVGITEFFEKC